MPTKGERCLEAIRRHLVAKHGASTRAGWNGLTPDELVRIIDEELAPKKRGPNSNSYLPDADWLAEQKAKPANQGIDWTALDRVFNQWCEDKKKRKTRARYLSFIRNADREFDPRNGNAVKTYHELAGWRYYLQERKAQGLFSGEIPKSFQELPQDTKKLMHSDSAKRYISQLNEFVRDNPEQWEARINRLNGLVA